MVTVIVCVAGNKYPEEICEQFPQLYSQPSCRDNLNASTTIDDISQLFYVRLSHVWGEIV